MSDMQVDFLDAQVKILRDACPDSQFITHNFMGLHNSLNYYDLAKNLDFVSWDNYPKLNPAIPYDASLAADVMRGLKKRNFLIMEQTAGPLGWATFSRNPQPGELRKICYQQLAHGADGQIWFRWRSCTVGREQYWHGLLGHEDANIRPLIEPPPGIEIASRATNDRELLFVINHSAEERTVTVPSGGKELLTDRQIEETVRLEAFGVAVLELTGVAIQKAKNESGE